MREIISPLTSDHAGRVRDIWDELEQTFGQPAKMRREPHFAYHVAADYDDADVQAALDDFAASHTAFTIRTTGLGIFTGEMLVLYIAIVRDPDLSQFQKDLWEIVNLHCTDSRKQYEPERWVPHITLAEGNIALDDIPQATEMLQTQDFQWTLTIDTLAMLTIADHDHHNISYQVPLASNDTNTQNTTTEGDA